MPSFTVAIIVAGDIPKKEIDRKIRVLVKALKDDTRSRNQRLRKAKMKRGSE